MGKASPQDPHSTSTLSQLDDRVFPNNRLAEIADAYPDNISVRCFVVPFVRHFFKCDIPFQPLYADYRANLH
jgi:hypothetical protein